MGVVFCCNLELKCLPFFLEFYLRFVMCGNEIQSIAMSEEMRINGWQISSNRRPKKKKAIYASRCGPVRCGVIMIIKRCVRFIFCYFLSIFRVCAAKLVSLPKHSE